MLRGKGILSLAAGRNHTVAVTSFGALYSWGGGDHGQLGHAARGGGPSSASLFVARTLNATGQSRVTLSLR